MLAHCKAIKIYKPCWKIPQLQHNNSEHHRAWDSKNMPWILLCTLPSSFFRISPLQPWFLKALNKILFSFDGPRKASVESVSFKKIFFVCYIASPHFSCCCFRKKIKHCHPLLFTNVFVIVKYTRIMLGSFQGTNNFILIVILKIWIILLWTLLSR